MRTIARWLLLILILMVPWEDTVTIGPSSSLARLMGVAVAGFWVLTVLFRGKLRRFRPFHAALVLFIAWNILSILWTVDPAVTQTRIKTYAQLGLLALILWDLLTTEASLRAGLQAYVLGSWVCVLSTIANYRAGIELEPYSAGRYTATGVNAVDLAVTLALALPVAWYLAVVVQGNSVSQSIGKLLNVAYLPAALFAIVLTGSRTSLFVVLPAIVYVLWSYPRLKLTVRVLILVALIGIGMILWFRLPQSTVERLGTVGTSITSGDLGGRVRLWRIAMAEFVAHPLTGIGSGGFSSTAIADTFVHNSFLSVLAETGMIGFVLFGVMLAIVAYQTLHQPKESSRMWGCVLLVWVMGALSLTWEFRKATWLFMSLVVINAGLPSVRRRVDESSARVSHVRALSGVLPAPEAITEYKVVHEPR